MKKIILDHFRRWWWLLATGGTTQMIVSCFSPITVDSTSDFLFFPFALFLGAFPLSFDLQRGHARAILALPVTVRQTALAWWLATVGLPAVMLILCSFFGAGISFACTPGAKFPLDWWAMNGVMNFLWLGITFFLLTGLKNGVASNRWEQARNVFFGGLWGLCLGGGFIFCEHLGPNDVKMALFLAVGTIMSVAGWFRAETLVLQRAGIRAITGSPGKKRDYTISKNFGGIPFLVTTMMANFVLTWLGMLAFVAIFTWLQNRATTFSEFIKVMIPTTPVFPYWMIMIFQAFPILQQLRLLRTLPVSTGKLAFLLVTWPILSMSVFVLTLFALVAPVIGTGQALVGIQNYSLSAAVITLGVPLFVWQGYKQQTIALAMATFILVVGVGIPLQSDSIKMLPGSWTLLISMLLIIAAYILTRRQLVRSSNAYRSWLNPTGNPLNWGR